METMKIRPLFILADLEAGGAQRVILTVIRHLGRMKFEPQLAIVNGRAKLIGDSPIKTRVRTQMNADYQGFKYKELTNKNCLRESASHFFA